MNQPMPWLRPLQFLVGALGVAIAVMATLWLQSEPVVPPAAGPVPPTPRDTVNDGDGEQATAGRDVQPVDPGTPVHRGTPTEAAASSTLLYGAVRRTDGTLVRDGQLRLHRDGKQVAYTSVSEGTYAIPGLAAGDYLLRGQMTGELPFEHELAVAGARLRHDLNLVVPWQLTVNAVDPQGAPLLDAVTKANPGLRLHRGIGAAAFAAPLTNDLPLTELATVTVGIGSFVANDMFRMREREAMPRQVIGVLTLPAGEPVHVALLLKSVVVAQMPVPAGQPETTFTLPVDALLSRMATVRLRAVDASGAPMAKINISLDDSQTSSSGKPTDADGRIVLTGLMPGRLGLGAYSATFRAPPVQIDVAAGADLDLGDVVLQAAVPLVVSTENIGKGGSIRARWLGATLANAAAREQYYGGDQGPTVALQLYPGRHSLVARGSGGVAITLIDTAALPQQPFRFDLQPGPVLRIDNRVGSGHVWLTLRRRDGIVVLDRSVDGNWVMELQLPAGEYEAVMTDAGGAVTQRAITLGAGGATLRVP